MSGTENKFIAEEPKADERVEHASYVVIGDQFGVELSCEDLDTACAYVADKLRAQAQIVTLTNPSSYRIKRVRRA